MVDDDLDFDNECDCPSCLGLDVDDEDYEEEEDSYDDNFDEDYDEDRYED